MNNSEKLIPVSFHLRNFNLYRSLDIPVSAHGNIALVGENAVGKTTLANCFFPMLVDGSIATPSFNPTTDTKKLKNSIDPRNSSHDSRTFESMLLGWGKGAMKVRTGYAYELLASKYREVILGIGAYRAKGDPRSKTWWFIATNGDFDQPLSVQTIDDNGKSLDRDAFIQANEGLGDHLHICEKARDFRERVAAEVYGLSGQELGLLAQADRMIASPMLTAGNAKFEPIRDALIQSQERIDPEIIHQVASFQRDVNDRQNLKKRIEIAVTRIDRIKQMVFLGNMDNFSSQLFDPYSKAQNKINAQHLKIDKLTKQAELTQQTVATQTAALAAADEQLNDLKFKKQREKVIQQERQQLQGEIQSLKKAVKVFKENQQRKVTLLAEQTEGQANLQQLNDQLTGLTNEKIEPLKGQIQSLINKLGWQELNYQTDLQTAAQDLADQIKRVSNLVNKYQRWLSNSQNLTNSIKVFTGTRTQMDDRIEVDVTGLRPAPIKEKLHYDNRAIHEAGAAKISSRYDELKQQMATLVAEHPEIKAALRDDQLLMNTDRYRADLFRLGQQSVTLQGHIEQAETKQQAIKDRLADIEANLDPTFNLAQTKQQIASLTNQLTNLKIDPTLNERIDRQTITVNNLKVQIDEAKAKVVDAHSQIKGLNEQIEDEQATMADLNERVNIILDQLKAYLPPVDEPLIDIDALVKYCAENKTAIRNNSIGELSNRVSRQINASNQDRLDNNAVNTLFDELGYSEIADQMFPNPIEKVDETFVASFDIDRVYQILETANENVVKALGEVESGRDLANQTYQAAVIQRIASQYQAIHNFNEMLSEGVSDSNGIKLKIELTPQKVDPQVIEEALDPSLDERPAVSATINKRLEQLANDSELANDEQAFNQRASELLDTRYWSQFIVKIKRCHSSEDDYEIVDDTFVESGGSGAEKAQAMVLPLLLVPKMILSRAARKDAPYLVMFDEFADKLDPQTARIFAKTINRFGFNFIATMPSGAQNKLLSDGVDNITYQVIAPQNRDDGKFHLNKVVKVSSWKA
ncbi:chromosome segregation ATPase [Lentilactobacillus fungorum]|uniref:Chromosome segregation ATPase n=1 Tax=Lentilactobacillus fungorum TaxID=2201250 RepID=A0ABQ3VYI5_9LACO|nr:SbcC/MukB-like Walker B domain-containing protein [Lentilactobacillus fungorum]GHP13953.1 chromosome segregation ATPase [Lentilactobacillus fungorum]